MQNTLVSTHVHVTSQQIKMLMAGGRRYVVCFRPPCARRGLKPRRQACRSTTHAARGATAAGWTICFTLTFCHVTGVAAKIVKVGFLGLSAGLGKAFHSMSYSSCAEVLSLLQTTAGWLKECPSGW